MALRFGTDGVRGVAYSVLSVDYVCALGAAASKVLDSSTILVGRDTRESGPDLLQAFADGCATNGVHVVDLGVAPTPAVAWHSRDDGVAGAVLSASHNPWSDNGVKLFASGGRKLSDRQQDAIQALLDATPVVEAPTAVLTAGSIEGYVDAVVASIDGRDLTGSRVVLDCAHGAASTTAVQVFERLGAEVVAVATTPDGRNINDGVGSTHPEHLASAVLAHRAEVGFAFDGDADRVVACGADGVAIDGDRIIAMGAIDRAEHGRLPHRAVVITVMTNLGFRRAMDAHDIAVVETPVGDRHVLEALDAGGYTLGGEQSGHIIHRDLATTGDGVLAAVQLLDAARRRQVDVGTWAASVMTSYPQVLENVTVSSPIADPAAAIATAIAAEEAKLGADGRVLIRASGTEPLIRVMVEAPTSVEATESAKRLVAAVQLVAENTEAG